MTKLADTFSNNYYYFYSHRTGNKYVSIADQYASKELHTDLEMIVMENQWEHIDWTIEPEKSFTQLLIDRCKQLREKYNYLTLYFSGGSDSETMVQSFIKAGISPDEIVLNLQRFNGINPIYDTEYAIQKLQVYKHYFNNTKITINELDRDILIPFLKKDMMESYIGGAICILHRITNNMLNQLGDPAHKKVPDTGHIFGELKPQIQVKDGKYYGLLSPSTTTGHHTEWFFTTLDLPDLHIKQCHLVKKYMKKHNLNPSGFLAERNPFWREHVQRACRFPFDNLYEPRKSVGLGLDFITEVQSESALLYATMKKYDPEFYDIYYSNTKDMIKAANPLSIDKKTMEFHGVRKKLYYIGE